MLWKWIRFATTTTEREKKLVWVHKIRWFGRYFPLSLVLSASKNCLHTFRWMSVTEFKSNPIKTIFRFQFGYHKMPMDYPLNPIRQFPILSHRNLSLIIVRTLTVSLLNSKHSLTIYDGVKLRMIFMLCNVKRKNWN